MTRHLNLWLLLAAGLSAFPAAFAQAKPDYPPTPVRPVTDNYHGVAVVDPYRWLEDAISPEVVSWTAAQNEFTRKTLATFPGREKLRNKLQLPFSVTTLSSPQLFGKRLFYSKRSQLQNQPVIYCRDGSQGAALLALDPNGLSADGTVAMDWMHPSADGARIAYGTSSGGTERSTLHIRDVVSGSDLGDSVPNTQHCSLVWDPDNAGFSYSRHPARGEVPEGEDVFHAQIFHHTLGANPKTDVVVFAEGKRAIQEERAVTGSSDNKWVFVSASLDWAKNDLYVRANGSNEPFRTVAEGLDGQVNGDGFGGKLYLLTNVEAPRYHVVMVDPAAPGRAHWIEIIPEQTGVIDGMTIAGGRLVLRVTEAAVSHLKIFRLDGKLVGEVPLPAMGAINGVTGNPESADLYFDYRTFTQPATVYHYDLATRSLAALEKSESGIDASAYEVTQVFVTSTEGARVPMFLVHKKGLAMDGSRPTLLTGYGGFALTESPGFRATWIPWLDMGGVYADACLRGGNEYGRAWHQAGRLGKKQNVFDDFYACAQWLVDHKVTDRGHLAAEGGSNGGLLVGAALTQRPEMFKAVVCAVPLLDMLRFQLFSIGRYWTPEYGSSEDSTQFPWLRAYSPYQNVKAGTAYPATLFEASEGDYRVDPLHAKKMAALVQASTSGDAPILLRIESKAGHGQGKPTAKRIDEGVDILSFLLMQMGISLQ